MIRFLILQEKILKNTAINLKDENITHRELGNFNVQDLWSSRFSEVLLEIPSKNQKELNEKGITEYTVITKTIVQIKKAQKINSMP